MTPSNDPNGKPLIYRIADALGVFHIVAPVNHTHDQLEVKGLVAALAAKAAKVSGATNNNLAALDANGDLKDSGHGVTDSVSYGSSSLITSGGVHAALQGKADKNKISETAENGAYAMVEAETTDKGQLTIGLKDAGDSSTDYTSLTKANIGNLKRALLDPDSTPTANSTNLVTSGGVKAALDGKQNGLTFDSTPTANSTNPVTSGGVKAAIDALLTNYIPIHQVAAILPKTTGHGSEHELQSWLGDGKMALVLQTARPVSVNIEATGVDDSPSGTWIDSTDFSFDLEQGIRTVKNIYELMYAQLQYDYPGERIGYITGWKIKVYAKDTAPADTICLINFYNPTINE